MGSKSKVARLPPEILDTVNELIRGGRTLAEILDKLRELGVEDISRSGLHRHVQQYEDDLKRYREAQEVAGVWISNMKEDPKGDVSRLLGEMLKTIAFQHLAALNRANDSSPQDLMFLGNLLDKIETHNKKAMDRAEREAAIRARQAAELKAAAKASLDQVEADVAAGAGPADPLAAIKRIRQEVYGIFDGAP